MKVYNSKKLKKNKRVLKFYQKSEKDELKIGK